MPINADTMFTRSLFFCLTACFSISVIAQVKKKNRFEDCNYTSFVVIAPKGEKFTLRKQMGEDYAIKPVDSVSFHREFGQDTYSILNDPSYNGMVIGKRKIALEARIPEWNPNKKIRQTLKLNSPKEKWDRFIYTYHLVFEKNKYKFVQVSRKQKCDRKGPVKVE